jgi:hypothetical protein
MNHKNAKRIVLFTAALVALFVLFSVSVGAGASVSKGATAGTPCCERHAPTQVAFPMMQQIAGTHEQRVCRHHCPQQRQYCLADYLSNTRVAWHRVRAGLARQGA